jgi:hypothetical protein
MESRQLYSPIYRWLSVLVVLSLVLSPAAITARAQDDTGGPQPPRTPTWDEEPVGVQAIIPGNATALALAMDIPQADIMSASIGTSDPIGTGISNGAIVPFPKQGSTFTLLSTGRASSATTPNTSGSLSYQLAGLNNSQGNDLVQMTLNLRVPSDKNCLRFDFAYYSEEYPEFVGSQFNDTFTVELGDSILKIIGNEVVSGKNFAFDPQAKIISVNTVGFATNANTTYDGATPLFTASRTVSPGETIKAVFSIQDLGDSIYDSAVFLDSFRWTYDTNCLQGSGVSREPIAIIVHGFQGATVIGGYDCAAALESLNSTGSNSTLGDLPMMFDRAGYDVWLAKYDSDHWLQGGTPPILNNAGCLLRQIEAFYDASSQNRQFILVAHSMGGVVSRVCLALFPNCRRGVKAFYTLGSPHAGMSSNLSFLYCQVQGQQGICDLSRDRMRTFFNVIAPNQRDIGYTFIGGNHFGPEVSGAVNGEGEHDGVVSSYSAVGWQYPDKVGAPVNWWGANAPEQIWTNETHHPHLNADGGKAYTAYRAPDVPSYAFDCMQWLEGRDSYSDVCDDATTANTVATAVANTSSPQTTEVLTGYIGPNTTITRTMPIDSNGRVVFSLIWPTTGSLGFVLVNPNGQLIDAAYASASNGTVVYSQNAGGTAAPGSAIYGFTTAVLGNWQLRMTATNDPAGADYYALVELETSRTLDISTNAPSFGFGQAALITATIQNLSGGIGGAIVTATLKRSDNVTDTVTLAHQGNGIYAANYTIPNAPGYLNLTVTATGSDAGIAFSRQQNLLLGIAPQTAQLNGAYSAQTPDADFNGKYDQINVQVGVNVNTAGSYSLVGDLVANGSAVAHTGAVVSLGAGAQTVTLNFSGNDIRTAQRNGPFTLANLTLSDNAYGSIPVQTLTTAWTTPAYGWQSFGSCYTLTKGTLPTFGGVVNVSPAPNCNNGTQYAHGTQVQLNTSTYLGYAFYNWIGSTSSTSNPLIITMDAAKVVRANLVESRIFLPLVRK